MWYFILHKVHLSSINLPLFIYHKVHLLYIIKYTPLSFLQFTTPQILSSRNYILTTPSKFTSPPNFESKFNLYKK
jgi:hypothetical protein